VLALPQGVCRGNRLTAGLICAAKASIGFSQELTSMTQDKNPSDSQDTPGRPTSESSRQQTQPNQGAQTGNSKTDSKAGHDPRNDHHVRNEK
jgi:hypothetical protein